MKSLELNPHYLHLAKKLDVDVNTIIKMSQDDVDALVEKKIGKKLEHTSNMGGQIPRGNPYIALGRFLNQKALINYFEKLFMK